MVDPCSSALSTSTLRPMTDAPTLTPILRPASRRWDRAGLLLSGLCAVHCLLMPLLLLVLPLHGAHALHDAWHPVTAALLIPVTLRAARRGDSPSSAGLLWGGLALIGLGLVAHDLLDEIAGVGLTLVGSLFLIAGHRCNLRCACTPSDSNAYIP